MAFVRKNLYKISSNFIGMKIYGYDAGADAAAVVDTSGYFNASYNDLDVGDEIRAVVAGGTVFKRYIVVTKTAPGTIDVSDGETIPLTNTD